MAPQRGEKQAIIFRTAEPLEADLFNVTLSFFSGQPNFSIAKFTLSATADARPSLAGHWEPVTMIRWSATDATLERKEGNQLRAVELREGNDTWDIDRFSRVLVQLYDRAPEAGVAPLWKAIDRADGSHPDAAAVDVLHAADGQGKFRGRYLRISSDSPVPKSPQLA